MQSHRHFFHIGLDVPVPLNLRDPQDYSNVPAGVLFGLNLRKASSNQVPERWVGLTGELRSEEPAPSTLRALCVGRVVSLGQGLWRNR